MAFTQDEIATRVCHHLEQLADNNLKIDKNTDLVEGLGLDSFKVLDLLLEIEDEFDLSIPMNVLADVRTVGDLVEKIHQLSEGSQ